MTAIRRPRSFIRLKKKKGKILFDFTFFHQTDIYHYLDAAYDSNSLDDNEISIEILSREGKI